MSNINDKLFLRILQIGRDNISGGLRFCDLTEQLTKEGYAINSCTNRTLREWFYTSFFHEEAHCDKGNPNSYNDVSKLDEHRCCHFILKGDSCMKLLQYEESENSNKQIELLQAQLNTLETQIQQNETNSNDAKKESSKAFWIAIGSMLLSGFSVFTDLANYNSDTDGKIQENTSKQISIQETILQQQIQSNQKIYNLLDSLAGQTSNDRRETNKQLENIYKSLKTKPK
jgi:hypothetical protein